MVVLLERRFRVAQTAAPAASSAHAASSLSPAWYATTRVADARSSPLSQPPLCRPLGCPVVSDIATSTPLRFTTSNSVGERRVASQSGACAGRLPGPDSPATGAVSLPTANAASPEHATPPAADRAHVTPGAVVSATVRLPGALVAAPGAGAGKSAGTVD